MGKLRPMFLCLAISWLPTSVHASTIEFLQLTYNGPNRSGNFTGPGFPRWVRLRAILERCFTMKFRSLRHDKELVLLSPAVPRTIGLSLLA